MADAEKGDWRARQFLAQYLLGAGANLRQSLTNEESAQLIRERWAWDLLPDDIAGAVPVNLPAGNSSRIVPLPENVATGVMTLALLKVREKTELATAEVPDAQDAEVDGAS